MRLRFVGIDSTSAAGNCPSVWVDEETGDFLFQGWKISDGAALLEISNRSPIAENEQVVRLPARMREIILEACGDGAANV
jgi:hypothetical protein